VLLVEGAGHHRHPADVSHNAPGDNVHAGERAVIGNRKEPVFQFGNPEQGNLAAAHLGANAGAGDQIISVTNANPVGLGIHVLLLLFMYRSLCSCASMVLCLYGSVPPWVSGGVPDQRLAVGISSRRSCSVAGLGWPRSLMKTTLGSSPSSLIIWRKRLRLSGFSRVVFHSHW